MIIRPAEPGDLEAIVEIHNEAILAGATAHGGTFSVDGRRGWLAERLANRPILVAEIDGAVVGFAELSDYRSGRRALRSTAEIGYFVHPGHRRKGVATALVRRCVELCPEHGIRVLLAILLETNRASVRVLEKLSFRRWAEFPGVASIDGREVGHLYYGLSVDGPPGLEVDASRQAGC